MDRDDLGKLDDFIVTSFRKSALLVADFTGMRTGMFFETGFAFGPGILVVWYREDHSKHPGEHFGSTTTPWAGFDDCIDRVAGAVRRERHAEVHTISDTPHHGRLESGAPMSNTRALGRHF